MRPVNTTVRKGHYENSSFASISKYLATRYTFRCVIRALCRTDVQQTALRSSICNALTVKAIHQHLVVLQTSVGNTNNPQPILSANKTTQPSSVYLLYFLGAQMILVSLLN